MDKIKLKMIEHTYAVILAITVFLFGSYLASLYVPVVTAVDATLVTRSTKSTTLRITGYKIRSCRLIPDSMVGWYINKAGQWAEISGPVTFPEDSSHYNSRPKDYKREQDFGLFRLNGLPFGSSTVRITMNHSCAPEDLRITTIGPWNIGEPS